jgi:hypothetical protein
LSTPTMCNKKEMDDVIQLVRCWVMDPTSAAALDGSGVVGVGGAPIPPPVLDEKLLATLLSPSLPSDEVMEATRQKALRLFQTGYAVDMDSFDVDKDDPTSVPITRQVRCVMDL